MPEVSKDGGTSLGEEIIPPKEISYE